MTDADILIRIKDRLASCKALGLLDPAADAYMNEMWTPAELGFLNERLDRRRQLVADEENQVAGWLHRMCGEEVFKLTDTGLRVYEMSWIRASDRTWLLWCAEYREFNRKCVVDNFGELVEV